MRIFRPKTDPFFRNRGDTDFTKIDPLSVEFRTMMRTFYMWEWRDRGGKELEGLYYQGAPDAEYS